MCPAKDNPVQPVHPHALRDRSEMLCVIPAMKRNILGFAERLLFPIFCMGLCDREDFFVGVRRRFIAHFTLPKILGPRKQRARLALAD
jgi:hypothetical protein